MCFEKAPLFRDPHLNYLRSFMEPEGRAVSKRLRVLVAFAKLYQLCSLVFAAYTLSRLQLLLPQHLLPAVTSFSLNTFSRLSPPSSSERKI
jgi:hypothetical protein